MPFQKVVVFAHSCLSSEDQRVKMFIASRKKVIAHALARQLDKLNCRDDAEVMEMQKVVTLLPFINQFLRQALA